MRRPRSKLQVSTFPFLAVLLCAMGSLMLFLFIMDRRAKIVERHRAVAARESFAAAKLVQTQEQRDARQAEWEKAREKLRQLLLDQQQQLLAESQGIQDELANANDKLQKVHAQFLSAQGEINGESGKIFLLQTQLEKEQENVKKVEKKETANKAELAKATQELLELTAALALLKTQKAEEKDVYSLVPYRGKRGDLRPPIYVECMRDGLVFHPEKKLLDFLHFTPRTLLAEIERYAGPLRAEKRTKEKDRGPVEEKKGPYVLFLVRPDGIANYYRAQGILRGIDIDFGYELVDELWVLDFANGTGASPKAPALPPSMPSHQVRATPVVSKAPAFIGPNLTGGQGPGTGTGGVPGGLPSPYGNAPQAGIAGNGPGLPSPFAMGSQGFGNGTGGAGNGLPSPAMPGMQGAGTGTGGPGNGLPSPFATGPQGIGSGTGNGLPSPSMPELPGVGTGPGGPASGLPSPFATGPQGIGSGPGGTGNGLPSPIGQGPQGVGQGGPGGSTSSISFGSPSSGGLGGANAASGLPNATAGSLSPQDPAFVPLAKEGSGLRGVPFATSGMRPEVIAASGLPGTPVGVNGGGANGSGAPGGNPPQTGAVNPNGPPSSGGGAPGAIGGPIPVNMPIPNPGAIPGQPSANSDPGMPTTPGTPSTGGGFGSQGSAAGGAGEISLNRAPLPAGFGAAPSKTVAAPTLSKILGNKDFIITVDCYADHVTMFPGGMQFRWTTQNQHAVDQAFLQSATKLIERRQASVRPGEPPYRPIVRFQVLPDGLRSYFHAYPLLERLHIPMTRENVEE